MQRTGPVTAFLLGSGILLTGASVPAQTSPTVAHPVYYIQTQEKAVALTFDVSWGETMLPKVLAVLESEKQPATFFLSGPWAETHSASVTAIRAAGGEIASHGQAHMDLGDKSASTIAANIGAADAILRAYTNAPLHFFRPPNGDWSPRVIETARTMGYETVIWSIDSRDWMNPGVPVIERRVIQGVFPGAIILLHASDTCTQTDLALPTIIQQVRKQGYRLVTLGDLWQMGSAGRDDPRGSGQKPNLT